MRCNRIKGLTGLLSRCRSKSLILSDLLKRKPTLRLKAYGIMTFMSTSVIVVMAQRFFSMLGKCSGIAAYTWCLDEAQGWF